MLRASTSTTILLLLLVVLPALDGWRQVANWAGAAAPPCVSRVLLRPALEQQTAVRARLAATLERRRRAEELAMAVVEERMTLEEAATRLGKMYRAAPDFPWHTVQQTFPRASDQECSCRLLIAEVRALGGPDREHLQAIAFRLEEELEYRLERERRLPVGGTAAAISPSALRVLTLEATSQ
jgi:hypothetical protein